MSALTPRQGLVCSLLVLAMASGVPSLASAQEEARFAVQGRVGTGMGYLPGGTLTGHTGSPEVPRQVKPGMAPTLLHLTLELDWAIHPRIVLAAQTRWQPLPAQDFDAVPSSQKEGRFPTTRAECLGLALRGDCMFGLRYKYLLTELGQPLRIHGTTGLHVGRSRHALTIKEAVLDVQGEPNPECFNRDRFERTDAQGQSVAYCQVRDTVRTGWLHWSLGLSALKPLGDSGLDLAAEVAIVLATPDNVGVDLDVTLGLRRAF